MNDETDFIFNYVMDHEDARRAGTITKDAGGYTRFGIAQKFHPEEFPALLQMSVADALARARILFMRDYMPEMIMRITDLRVAAKIVDVDFNLGAALGRPHGLGIEMAQRACCLLGRPVIKDGTLGAMTLEAINDCDPQRMLNAMCAYEQATIEYEYMAKRKTPPPGLITRAKDQPKLPAAVSTAVR